MANNMANKICERIFSTVFTDKQTPKKKKFDLFLLDEIIEHLGFEIMSDKWSQF